MLRKGSDLSLHILQLDTITTANTSNTSCCAGLTEAAWKYVPDSGLKHPCGEAFPASLHDHETWNVLWQDIRPDQVWDAHVHLVGVGDA